MRSGFQTWLLVSFPSLRFFFTSLGLELSDTKVYEPDIRALLGTASHYCEAVVLKSRAVPSGTALGSFLPAAVLNIEGVDWSLNTFSSVHSNLLLSSSPSSLGH